MENLEIGAMVAGLTEMIKSLGHVPSQYCEALAVLVALLLVIAKDTSEGRFSWYGSVVNGLFIGLTTTGLYKAVKK